jgi:3-isopropylmalate dehydrogenase
MMLRYSFEEPQLADRVDQAVDQALKDGLRTADIASVNTQTVSTSVMGDAVVAALRK